MGESVKINWTMPEVTEHWGVQWLSSEDGKKYVHAAEFFSREEAELYLAANLRHFQESPDLYACFENACLVRRFITDWQEVTDE